VFVRCIFSTTCHPRAAASWRASEALAATAWHGKLNPVQAEQGRSTPIRNKGARFGYRSVQLHEPRTVPMTSPSKEQEGKIGYVIAWLLGVPLPILFLVALLRGCS